MRTAVFTSALIGSWQQICFFFCLGRELEKLATHEEVVYTGRGSVEEIPTDSRVQFHHDYMPSQISRRPT
jgi:hypothetical protein